jgi:threonyl-tRNA synthetase
MAAVEKAMTDLKLGDAPVKSTADAVAEKKPYYQKRISIFEGFAEREKAKVEAAKQANVAITITLPDGGQKPGVKGATTPFDVASSISKSLAKKCVVAEVDGADWDMCRPLEGDCALKLFSFEDAEGREVRFDRFKTCPCRTCSGRDVACGMRGELHS